MNINRLQKARMNNSILKSIYFQYTKKKLYLFSLLVLFYNKKNRKIILKVVIFNFNKSTPHWYIYSFIYITYDIHDVAIPNKISSSNSTTI